MKIHLWAALFEVKTFQSTQGLWKEKMMSSASQTCSFNKTTTRLKANIFLVNMEIIQILEEREENHCQEESLNKKKIYLLKLLSIIQGIYHSLTTTKLTAEEVRISHLRKNYIMGMVV